MLTEKDLARIENMMESKLESKLEPMRKDINKIKGTIGQINDFIENDSKGIENEISLAVKYHLEKQYSGFNIDYCALKNLFSTFGNQRVQVTEFDGAFFVSNLQPVKHKYAPETDNEQRKVDRTVASKALSKSQVVIAPPITPMYVMIIVEAKHFVNRPKINNKIQTVCTILDMIETAKQYASADRQNKKKFDPNIATLVKNFKFDKITDVQLYIGGPMWDENMVAYVKRISNGIEKLDRSESETMSLTEKQMVVEATFLPALKNRVGMIYPSGNRYFVANYENLYSPDTNVAVTGLVGGAKYSESKIVPHYIDFKFT